MLNRDKYNDSLKYMPADFNELVIEGGNHVGFGSYGAQAGDGGSDDFPGEAVETDGG